MRSRLFRRLLPVAAALSVFSCTTPPTRVVLEVGNLFYPDFHDTVETRLSRKNEIGDSRYYLEAVRFYPHFAIIDSTGDVVSLSTEPKNPAVKIRVYQGADVIEETWAFYLAKAPHYARTAFLTFKLVSFVYQGKQYGPIEEGRAHEQERGQR